MTSPRFRAKSPTEALPSGDRLDKGPTDDLLPS